MKLTKDYYRKLNEKEFTVKEVKNGKLSTFSYVHGGVDFTDRKIRLARGLTLDENDNVVTVGFEKFFLENQLDTREEYSDSFKQEFTKLNEKSYKAYEKLDGTLIILGVYEGNFIVSTTSSTLSEHALNASIHFNSIKNKQKLMNYMIEKNVCLLFEYISKFNQIAVYYEIEGDYVLLGEVNKENFQLTLSDEIDLNFTKAKVEYFTYDELQRIKTDSQDIEGYVVWNEYGRAIKIKTDWWFTTHMKNTIFFNTNKLTKKIVEVILEAILNDTIDELYAVQNSNELWKKRNYVSKIHDIYLQLTKTFRENALKFSSVKEIALSDIQYKNFVIEVFKGRELKVNSLRDLILENLR